MFRNFNRDVRISVYRGDQAVNVQFEGTLTCDNAEGAFNWLIPRLDDASCSAFFSLRDLHYVDSMGISFFVRVGQHLGKYGRKLTMLEAQPDVKRNFELVRLDRFFDLEKSESIEIDDFIYEDVWNSGEEAAA